MRESVPSGTIYLFKGKLDPEGDDDEVDFEFDYWLENPIYRKILGPAPIADCETCKNNLKGILEELDVEVTELTTADD